MRKVYRGVRKDSPMKKTMLCAAFVLVVLTSRTSAKDRDATTFPEKGILRVLVSTVTETTATILWQTRKEDSGEVHAWTLDRKVIRQKEAKPCTSHSVTLTGLQSDAIYHFYIRAKSGRSHLHSFRTVKPLQGKPEFTMAVIADPQFHGKSGRGAENFRHVVAEVNEQKVDLVLFPGDLVEKGSREMFLVFRDIADKLTMPYFVVPGNHERLDVVRGLRAEYCKIFGLKEAHYSRDLFGKHLVFLDCRRREGWRLDAEQFGWLVKDLAANKDKDVYVIAHYAIAADPYVFDASRGRMPKVQVLLESHGRVRAVYAGHKNVISATVQRGILYVSCPQPSAGPQGYLLVRVYRDGLVQTFRNTPGLARPLADPVGPARGAPNPDKVRWDGLYRWGRQGARNFSWCFGEPCTSTGIR